MAGTEKILIVLDWIEQNVIAVSWHSLSNYWIIIVTCDWSPGDSVTKKLFANARDASLCSRHGFNPWFRKIPGEGNGSPLQYSCLENTHGQRSLAGYRLWGWKRVGHDLARWSPRKLLSGHIISPVSTITWQDRQKILFRTKKDCCSEKLGDWPTVRSRKWQSQLVLLCPGPWALSGHLPEAAGDLASWLLQPKPGRVKQAGLDGARLMLNVAAQHVVLSWKSVGLGWLPWCTRAAPMATHQSLGVCQGQGTHRLPASRLRALQRVRTTKNWHSVGRKWKESQHACPYWNSVSPLRQENTHGNRARPPLRSPHSASASTSVWGLQDHQEVVVSAPEVAGSVLGETVGGVEVSLLGP